jgi:HEAT repeat protein
LGAIGDSRALLPLAVIIGSGDDEKIALAAKAVVAIRKNLDDPFAIGGGFGSFREIPSLRDVIGERGIANLQRMLVPTAERETIVAVITLLGWLNAVSAISVLFRFAEHGFEEEVERAMVAIGGDAVPFLREVIAERRGEMGLAMAVRALRWLGEREESVLIPLLKEAAPELQAEILSTLTGTTEERLLPIIIPMMKEGDPIIVWALGEVLSHYKNDSIDEAIHQLLTSPVAAERCRGIRFLGSLRTRVTGQLLRELFSDSDPTVRREAVRMVESTREVKAESLLIEALHDPAEQVREEAAIALATVGSSATELLPLLGVVDQSLDFAIIKAIGLIAMRDCSRIDPTPLLAYLAEGNKGRAIVYAAIEALGRLRHPMGVPFLGGALQQDDPDIRRLAVISLGAVGEEGMAKLLEASCDSHWSVRLAAVLELAKYPKAESLDQLTAMCADPDILVRQHAVLALGDLGDLAPMDLLIASLIDPITGKAAFEALLKVGPRGLPLLHRLVQSETCIELRERMVCLLGKMGKGESIEVLVDLLEDNESVIRAAAVDSLVHCFDSIPLKKLAQLQSNDPNEDVKLRAKFALKTMMMEKYC